MNCQEIQKSLSSYMEGLLSPDERERVEGHLSSCAQCSASLAELEKTKDLLRNLDNVEPPPWLTAKIMARVREEKEERSSFFKKLFFPFHIKIPLQALSVILVGVIIFQIYRMAEPEKKVSHVPSPPSPAAEKKALKEETPPSAAKPETLSPQSSQKTVAGKLATKKEKSAQLLSGEQGRGVQKPRVAAVPAEENAPVMAQASKDKSKQEVAGLTNAPRQTEASEQRTYEKAQEDAEKTAALFDKKEAKEKPRVPILKDAIKEPPVSQPPMPLITLSAPDTAAAKKSVEDIVKQLGGKQIEAITRDATETIITELPSGKINELSENLKGLGEIKTKPGLADLPEGTVCVQIDITPR